MIHIIKTTTVGSFSQEPTVEDIANLFGNIESNESLELLDRLKELKEKKAVIVTENDESVRYDIIDTSIKE